MPALLPCFERESAAQPTHAVIWLHGLGANGSDFLSTVDELGLPSTLAVRFVFPNAPRMPVTCSNGYVMPAWYDILDFEGIERTVDHAGIAHSCAAIRALIAREVERGIAEDHIVIAGFSQGGVIALSAALTHPRKLAGVMALSTYLPGFEQLPLAVANRPLPIFIGHGGQDPVVPYALGLRAKEQLTAAGYQPEMHSYIMPHSVCPTEVRDIGAWLTRVLG